MESQLITAEGLKKYDPVVLARIYNGAIGTAIRKHVMQKGGAAEDGEDVLVLTILRAKKLIVKGKYTEQGRLSAFIITIGKLIWKEELKKRKKEKWRDNELLVDQDFQYLLEMDSSKITLTQAIASLSDQIDLELALQQLSPNCQEVIRLHYFEGYTLADAGRMLNYSQAGVLHSRCLEKLRKIISQLEK